VLVPRPGAVTREAESSRWALSAPSPAPPRGKKFPLPAGSSAKIPFGGQEGKWVSGYRSTSGRSRKAPLGEPGSVVVVVSIGAVVVVTASVVMVVSAGAVVVVVSAGTVAVISACSPS